MPRATLLHATLALALLMLVPVASLATDRVDEAGDCTVPEGRAAFQNTLDDMAQGQLRPLAAAHFSDHSGAVTAAEISARTFDETPCLISFPIAPPEGALWLRFSISNPHGRDMDWTLAFMETILDEITLYEQTATGLILRARNGRAVPADQQAMAGAKFAVPVRMAPGEEARFYLRVAGTFSEKITPTLVSTGFFHRWAASFGNVSAVLLGFTAMLAIISTALFRHVSARFYKYYTMFM
ncbi:MAG: 7TM-DISM domain-containing protein, partial [Pseudomonadota bacterium]